MKVIYALQGYAPSIFLAGPTPRRDDVQSWRPEALRILEKLGFAGDVLVPESRDRKAAWSYDGQISWEWAGLNQASIVLFWIPRDIDTMPAFTTNVEFGMLAHTSKVVLGYPEDAPKMGYLEKLAGRYDIPILHSLEATCNYAVERCAFLASDYYWATSPLREAAR